MQNQSAYTQRKIDWMDMTLPPINLYNVPAFNASSKLPLNQEVNGDDWGDSSATGRKQKVKM